MQFRFLEVLRLSQQEKGKFWDFTWWDENTGNKSFVLESLVVKQAQMSLPLTIKSPSLKSDTLGCHSAFLNFPPVVCSWLQWPRQLLTTSGTEWLEEFREGVHGQQHLSDHPELQSKPGDGGGGQLQRRDWLQEELLEGQNPMAVSSRVDVYAGGCLSSPYHWLVFSCSVEFHIKT